jgi:hypothetical protein
MTNNKISKLKNIIHLYTNTENMTNNKLAVEWLGKSYVDLLTKLNNDEISLKEFEIQYIEILEQAKEMEKEQTINFTEDWYFNGPLLGEGIDVKNTIEQHFNNTYGDDKQ